MHLWALWLTCCFLLWDTVCVDSRKKFSSNTLRWLSAEQEPSSCSGGEACLAGARDLRKSVIATNHDQWPTPSKANCVQEEECHSLYINITHWPLRPDLPLFPCVAESHLPSWLSSPSRVKLWLHLSPPGPSLLSFLIINAEDHSPSVPGKKRESFSTFFVV